uniref:Integrase zinc-binding domain-containing protein n=1 Tax=Ditylenchus dipsaci TaxID=166011 RepID=A0A915ENV3_9BILA
MVACAHAIPHQKDYWLPKGRKAVAQIIRKWCISCRKLSVAPFSLPKYAPFPSSRVKPNPPFANTGMTISALLTSKEGGSSKKFWGHCLHACGASSSHGNSADLSADKFLDAFKASC